MPRKSATTATDGSAEPRRSARIKDQPKPTVSSKKAPAKPRARKTKANEQPVEDAAEEPKPTKGRKRAASEVEAEDAALNGASDVDGPPPAKRVRILRYRVDCTHA